MESPIKGLIPPKPFCLKSPCRKEAVRLQLLRQAPRPSCYLERRRNKAETSQPAFHGTSFRCGRIYETSPKSDDKIRSNKQNVGALSFLCRPAAGECVQPHDFNVRSNMASF